MNDEHSRMASSAICFAADQVKEFAREAVGEWGRPCAVFKPTLSADGTMWCVLLGENLQEGVAGFGETPAKAMHAFDLAFLTERTPAARSKDQA